jgi:hypothetical protein
MNAMQIKTVRLGVATFLVIHLSFANDEVGNDSENYENADKNQHSI